MAGKELSMKLSDATLQAIIEGTVEKLQQDQEGLCPAPQC